MTIQEHQQLYNMLASIAILIRHEKHDKALSLACRGMDRISEQMSKQNVSIIDEPLGLWKDSRYYKFVEDTTQVELEENLKRNGIDVDALLARVKKIVETELGKKE